MEKEFMDLIQTFEKTATRLETLDTTLLNFKGIIDGLRHNLDEVVEMVQLEEINELATQCSLKLEVLNQNLGDTMQKTPKQQGNVVTTQHAIYYIEDETNQLMLIETGVDGYKGAMDGVIAQKIVLECGTVFVLDQTGDIIVFNGRDELRRYPLNATDFAVSGYALYYLTNNHLMKYHLLDHTTETLHKEVESFELEKDLLKYETF